MGADVLEGVEHRTADPISLRVYERVRRRDFGIIRDLSGRYPAHSLEDRQWPEPRNWPKSFGVSEAQVSRDERNEYHGITVDRAEGLDAMNEP